MGSLAVGRAQCVRALLLRSDRCGMGSPISFEASYVIRVSLLLFVTVFSGSVYNRDIYNHISCSTEFTAS